jgi:hypothetical protein
MRRIDNIWAGIGIALLLTVLLMVPVELSLIRFGVYTDVAIGVGGAFSGLLVVLISNWLLGVPPPRR